MTTVRGICHNKNNVFDTCNFYTIKLQVTTTCSLIMKHTPDSKNVTK